MRTVADTDGNGCRIAKRYAYRNRNSNGNSNTDTNCNTDAHAYADAKGYAVAQTSAESGPARLVATLTRPP